jgi:phospholipase/carboxylesterase
MRWALTLLVACGTSPPAALPAPAERDDLPVASERVAEEASTSPEPAPPVAAPTERTLSVAAGELTIDTTLVGGGRRPLLLLHGYGGDGADMLPLGRLLAAEADVTVAVPTAPHLWRHGAPGRAWFERTDADANAQIERAATEVEAVLAALAAERPGAPILVGFSQGAQLAIELALRSTGGSPAGLAVLSGRALPRFRRRWSVLSGVPVLVTHGRADPLIPFRDGERIAREAERAGALVTFVPFEGGHELPVEVETALFGFLDPGPS